MARLLGKLTVLIASPTTFEHSVFSLVLIYEFALFCFIGEPNHQSAFGLAVYNFTQFLKSLRNVQTFTKASALLLGVAKQLIWLGLDLPK